MSYTYCSYNDCENGAHCLTDGFKSICDCYPCFTGPKCEQNLTSLTPIYAVWSYNLPKEKNKYFILFQCFVIIILIDNLLCIQTILSSRKIFNTNLGVYLIVLNLMRIAVGIVLQITIINNLNRIEHSINFLNISLGLSFFYVSIWSSSFISIEKMLIQRKYFDIQLYDRKWRSLIILICLFLFVFLTQFIIPYVIYIRKGEQYNDALEIFIRTVILVHHLIPFVLHLIASIVVLIDLVKHQIEFGVAHGSCYLIWGQIRKHRDFFIQPFVYICCTLPFISIFLAGIYLDNDCSQINKIFSQKHILLYCSGIFFIPILFAFPVYIWSSKVYMIEFQTSSIAGKCYMKLKSKCHVWLCQKCRADRNEIEEENTHL